MPVVYEKVAFVNRPKQAGWSGSIKTASGEYYNVKEDMLHNFTVGAMCNFQYEESKKLNKDGKPYRNFLRFVDLKPLAPTPGEPIGGGRAAPQPQTSPSRPRHAQTGNGAVGRSYDQQSRLIFITGVVGRAMGSGQFKGPDAIISLTMGAVEAWDWLELRDQPDREATPMPATGPRDDVPPPDGEDDYGA